MRIKELKDYLGKKIVERARKELTTERRLHGRKVKRRASGELSRSLTYSVKGKKLGFFAKGKAGEYASFIHYGVNGTKYNYGAPFSYRNEFVGAKMISGIEQWMEDKNIRLRKVVSRNGVKVNTFVKDTPENRKSAAFAIAKGVKKRGIAPTPFFDMAVREVMEREEKVIEEAINKEIEFILDL
jgi:hypothetical protein